MGGCGGSPSRQAAKPPSRQEVEEPPAGLDRLARRVLEAAMEVHREVGPGFAESAYEMALAIELGRQAIPFERQPTVRLRYKGHDIGEGRMDLLVGGQLVVELKAVEALAPVHISQVLAYLKATRLTLGLLINFNVRRLALGVRRVVLTHTV
jgi:GxxExxY protein